MTDESLQGTAFLGGTKIPAVCVQQFEFAFLHFFETRVQPGKLETFAVGVENRAYSVKVFGFPGQRTQYRLGGTGFLRQPGSKALSFLQELPVFIDLRRFLLPVGPTPGFSLP